MKEESKSKRDSLATSRPDVAATWSLKNAPLVPDDFAVNSHKSVWWVESCGHEFLMPIARRTGRKLSCKICSGQELLIGFNDLATTHPELINEWDFSKNNEVTPTSVQKGSKYTAWWLGKTCGHSWDAKVSSRTRSNPSGCPICKNLRVVTGINDLATNFPEIAKEFDYSVEQKSTPQNTPSGSEKAMSWICPNGHSPYKASPYSRTVKGTGCPVCVNKKIQVGVNDLLTVYPEIAKEWDYERNKKPPTDYSFGSHSKAWFVCPNLHSYQTVIRKRADGNGCPYCGKKLVLRGFNDLETEFPEIANEWDLDLNKKKPSEVISGSVSKAWFKCKHGHSYRTMVQHRTRMKTGCPVCSNHKLLKGYNDLQTKLPEIAKQWHPTKNKGKLASDFVSGSHSMAWFICDQGHEWKSTIVDRQKRGCPSCAEYGFKPHMPGVFYFIENTDLKSRKIGVTNFEARNVRLSAFKRAGWKELLIITDSSGEKILELEKSMLKWIRNDLSMPIHLTSKEVGRKGGWTETFSNKGISNIEIIDRVVTTAIELGFEINDSELFKIR
jgi:hypothetical protein